MSTEAVQTRGGSADDGRMSLMEHLGELRGPDHQVRHRHRHRCRDRVDRSTHAVLRLPDPAAAARSQARRASPAAGCCSPTRSRASPSASRSRRTSASAGHAGASSGSSGASCRPASTRTRSKYAVGFVVSAPLLFVRRCGHRVLDPAEGAASSCSQSSGEQLRQAYSGAEVPHADRLHDAGVRCRLRVPDPARLPPARRCARQQEAARLPAVRHRHHLRGRPPSSPRAPTRSACSPSLSRCALLRDRHPVRPHPRASCCARRKLQRDTRLVTKP